MIVIALAVSRSETIHELFERFRRLRLRGR
jgi:hypothetical protein